LSVDPLQAKYASLSSYNFTANNPIIFIDQDGRDFRYSVTVSNSGPIVVNIETTIHLYGKDASLVDQSDYTQNRLTTVKIYNEITGKIETRTVIVKITVKFVVEKSKEDAEAAVIANPGDNMMEVDKSLNLSKEGENYLKVPEMAQQGGTNAKVNDPDNREAIVHGVLHNIGLGDRYGHNEDAAPVPDLGFNNTVMATSSSSTNLHEVNVNDLANYVLKLTDAKSTIGSKFHHGKIDETPSRIGEVTPVNYSRIANRQ